jgi:organic radical activating enzyme
VWNGESIREGDNPITGDELGRLIQEALRSDDTIEAIALTGGEPLAQADFLAGVLSAQSFHRPVLLETNGMLPTRLPQLLPFIDIVSMDMKLPSNSGEKAFWNEHAEFLRIGRSRELYVKIVVDEATESAEIDHAAQLIARHASEAIVYLQPITAPTGAVSISPDKLTILYTMARKHLKNLRILPQTHKMMNLR